MADKSPDAFIVRILGLDARPAGIGALVGPRQVVTCAHVVNTALGLEARAQDEPTETVIVEFPLLRDAADGDVPQCRARIIRWLPPPREGVAGDDIAGLVLDDPPPDGAEPARLVVNQPNTGKVVRVFGYPGTPPRPDGAWVTTMVQGRVGGGRLQLDSTDAALRVQPGFSGGPVYDDTTGRVVGLLASSAPGRAAERDSYAISADRLRLAWPEALGLRQHRAGTLAQAKETPAMVPGELTILHMSDTQFGRHHIFGGNGLTPADTAYDTLFHRLHADLSGLASEYDLRPDLIVVTGDLAEWGLRSEFEQVIEFLGALCEAVEIPRQHVAIVPGNHDVNRKICEAYFAEQEGDERDPVSPYWPKWRQFAAAFAEFYADVETATFTPDEPWTLYEMPNIGVVVAGLNSTLAESHRDGDHYGWVGEHQLHWFADRLAGYRDRGWLRLAAIHHNVVRGAVLDEENLRDADDLDRLIGHPGLVNLLLHGHTHSGQLHRLASGLIALSTGSAAVNAAARPAEIPNQYQLITVRHDGFSRYARQYALGERRWIGDNRVSPTGSNWKDWHACQLSNVDAALAQHVETQTSRPAAERRSGGTRSRLVAATGADGNDISPSSHEDFLDRVGEATRANFPEATITLRPESGYLRVSNPLPGGGAEQWPVGTVNGPLTEDGLDMFINQVHSQFVSADPSVRSEFVVGGPPVPDHLVRRARQCGIRLRTFVEYQGLLDLRPLVNKQNEKLGSDRIYPAELYVPQRFRILDGSQDGGIRTGLIEQAVKWLSADSARLVMVLGDFGRGKTSFLRQLARMLPAELPAVLPVLVELRSLEKAPTLDELLAQYLVRQGVEDINPGKLRYMIRSGRLALLFDGFDELELRVGYDNAADYLQVLLQSVSGQAKVVLTSRTQHFRSTGQIRTALGERVATLTGSRVTVLEDFSNDQILQFLANLYGGDQARARQRFDLIGDIEDLLGLAANPRMLAFIAALDEDRLRAVQQQQGRISAAELYREIISSWLAGEAKRQQYHQGLPSLDEKERLAACTALALKLWASTSLVIGLAELSAEISATLTRLAERGYTSEQASHSIGSGSLLVRTEDGAFTFVHQSIMEWLVADAAARALDTPSSQTILTTRRMSKLMIDFFGDLAGPSAAHQWAAEVLADSQSSQPAKQNALAITERVNVAAGQDATRQGPEQQNLAGVDLRSQNLTGRDLRQANLRGADLRSMRLEETDFSGADLRDANFTGVRLVRGSLREAALTGSRWDGAALLGTQCSSAVLDSPELRAAAITSRDPTELMLQPFRSAATSVAFSPDGTHLAVGFGQDAWIVNVADGRTIRVLGGHENTVRAVAFSPDGALLATASDDRTARIWDTATGTTRTTLQGHDRALNAVAFSPDGALLATASDDGTARIWDTATGNMCVTLQGHTDRVRAVAFSPDGALLATASDDRTARIWDTATGTTRTTLQGHDRALNAVAFSPDGALLATASGDRTARIWDTATGTTRTTLQGHDRALNAVAFSPDGALLATASDDRTARIWDTATGTSRTTLQGHTDRVRAVAFSPDGALLATASDDRTARIWDTATGTTRTTLQGHDRALNAVAFSPDGALLATASDDRTARIWDTATGTTRTTLQGHTDRVRAVAFSPDGALLATASGDDTARIWDTATGTTRTTLQGHDRALNAVAFSPDGALLATASDDRTARIWDTATGTSRTTLQGHTDWVRAVAFSPDGALLATASDDGTARIWDTTGTTCVILKGHTNWVWAVAFSPDGALLATASDDWTARIWDTATGTSRTTLQGHTDWVRAVAFSPDGALLATASDDRTARIWDTATGTTRTTLQGHDRALNAVAFSPDGALLATASDDGTVRIWDTATGNMCVTLIPLSNYGYATLTADGYKLDGDSANRLWWAIKLCRFAPGELDPFLPSLCRLPANTPLLGLLKKRNS